MASKPKRTKKTKKVDDYRHQEAERLNNPPAGLAWQDTEKPEKRRFEYDPHLDPQLVWAGKAERMSFEVEAPSIHVHERLSADDIIRSVMKEPAQPALFDYEELDRTKAVDFYRHEMGWENRLILGDSLVVMTSLLEKERLGGQVQMIYIDPPYGVNYNSNFQSRISSRNVRETDEHLTREPEQIQAYRDTWEVGVHSYLSYLRDRLTVARELLADSGSIFVQISVDNTHRVRALLEEVFGSDNHVNTITFFKTSGAGAPSELRTLPVTADILLWYAKDRGAMKFRPLFRPKQDLASFATAYSWVELPDGSRRRLTAAERDGYDDLPHGSRLFRLGDLTSQTAGETTTFEFELEERTFRPRKGGWKTNAEGMHRLIEARRVMVIGNTPSYVRYADDFPGSPFTDVWTDTVVAGFASDKRYVVQTAPRVVARCLLLTTDPGDLVLDPTVGSGTTLVVAEQFGRRWAGIDTSRVAVAVTRERLLTAKFDFYSLADAPRGVDGGFQYRSLRRRTLRSIARGEEPEQVVMYDQPEVDPARVRVSGPFTVEALSRYAVNPSQEHVPPEPDDPQAAEPQDHVRTLLDALAKQGIPRKGGQPANVLRVEPLASTGALHAEGIYEGEDGAERRFAVSLGPRFGPVTVQQVDEALHDAYGYDLVVFAGFAATAEAQDYVAGGKRGRFNVALLEANPDLLVGDLLKSTPSSQTFRLFAAPDITLDRKGDGDYSVQVLGVDLFDASTGETKFVGDEYIAAWFLDSDYDGMVFHVDQAFFPDGGWEKLAKTLKGTVDEELMEQLQSFQSLPFKAGEHKKAAVRVIDDAGTTSEVVLELE